MLLLFPTTRPRLRCRPTDPPIHRPYASISTQTDPKMAQLTIREMLYAARSTRCRPRYLTRPTTTTIRLILPTRPISTTRPILTQTRPMMSQTSRRRREASTTRRTRTRPAMTRLRYSRTRPMTTHRGPRRPRLSLRRQIQMTQTRCESTRTRPMDQNQIQHANRRQFPIGY